MAVVVAMADSETMALLAGSDSDIEDAEFLVLTEVADDTLALSEISDDTSEVAKLKASEASVFTETDSGAP